MASIPITTGTGAASVATETVSGISYQQIQVYGGGGASVLSVNPDGSLKASIIGTPTVSFSGSPSISGAVTIVGSSIPTGSVSGTVGASIFGIVPTRLVDSNSSLLTITQNGNDFALDVNISQITVSTSSPIGVVGTAASGTTDIGNPIKIGGVFNTTQASVSSGQRINAAFTSKGALLVANGVDAFTASVVGTVSINPASVSGIVGASIIGNANTTITSIATANGGLHIWAPLGGSWVQGTSDFRIVQGASITTIAAQGAGVRTYVNYVQIANFGPSSVLVTIADNTTSILGYTIAPAGGGSNYQAFYRSAANSPVTASINGTASVLVSMQGFTSST